MGNQDNWTTPKQIKIERAGEPRGYKRGPGKKKDRKKGKKARIDEILSAKSEAERYREYTMRDTQDRLAHPEKYSSSEFGLCRRYNPMYRKWFQEVQVKLKKLINKAVIDGVLAYEDSLPYYVELLAGDEHGSN